MNWIGWRKEASAQKGQTENQTPQQYDQIWKIWSWTTDENEWTNYYWRRHQAFGCQQPCFTRALHEYMRHQRFKYSKLYTHPKWI